MTAGGASESDETLAALEQIATAMDRVSTYITERDAARATAALATIERLLVDAMPGQRNPELVRAIAAQLRAIEAAVGERNGSGLVHEKAASIRGGLEILFSERKHEKYGGAERYRGIIMNDCGSLRIVLGTIFRAG